MRRLAACLLTGLWAAGPAYGQESSDAAPPSTRTATSTAGPPTQDYDPAYAAVMTSGRRVMTAEPLREGERIVLDGSLDEAVWQRAVPATDFIQQDPILGGTPTERTEVRIAFDRTRLYMGVICFDSEPDRLLGNTMKRDEFLGGDDRFMWTIDTFLDQQTGYFFEMNPSGLMADSLMGASGDNRNWDGIWDARVRRSEIGWTIELEIPFSTLSFDPNAPAWGINFQRTIRRKAEENLWTGYQRNQGLRRMSNAGLLTGIRGVSQGLGFDVRPYVAADVFDSPGAEDPQPLQGDGNVGVDVFYNFTPSLRGNVTINTDFAETEVDQRLVNLTRFPLFFPEKRAFFLDGATYFDFYTQGGGGGGGSGGAPVRPFFSRRIGLDDEGVQQGIDVGGKLTGQLGSQDVGVLYVRTREHDALPGEDFAVVRLKRRFLAQSYVAAIYTGRNARDEFTETRNAAGIDLRLATSTFRGDQNVEFDSFFLWTTDVLNLGENAAYGARIGFPNDPWSGNFSYEVVEENHDPAVGFVQRTGYHNFNPRIAYQPRPQNHPWIRNFDFSGSAQLYTDPEHRWLTREIRLQPLRIQTHSQDNFGVNIEQTYERLDEDFEISEGIILPFGEEYSFTRYQVEASSANRRLVSLRAQYGWGGFFSGDRRETQLNIGLRPRAGVRLELEGEWNDIDLAEGSFTTSVYRLISDTQFNPWIFIVNNLQYDSVSKLLGWQARFRWTLTPGSDLFVVYTHNWLEDVTFDRFVTQDRRGATKFVYTRRF